MVLNGRFRHAGLGRPGRVFVHTIESGDELLLRERRQPVDRHRFVISCHGALLSAQPRVSAVCLAPLKYRLSTTADKAASRMPLCSRGASSSGSLLKNRSETTGIIDSTTLTATM